MHLEIGHLEFSLGKAPRAGNSGSISKRGYAASADFRVQPEGPGPFSCLSALFVVHLTQLNLSPHALRDTKMAPGAVVDIIETASSCVGGRTREVIMVA